MARSLNAVWQKPKTAGSGCVGCRRFIIEEPEINIPSIDPDLRSPLLVGGVPSYPSVIRRSPRFAAFVLSIPMFRDDSEVAASIVQANSVEVVDITVVGRNKSEHCSMERGVVALAVFASATAGVPFRIQSPRPLICPFSISSIDDSVSADAAIACPQGNQGGRAVFCTLDGWFRRSRSNVSTAERAVGSANNGGSSSRKHQAARRAGTLNRHHDLLSRTRGVGPVGVESVYGATCVDYTGFYLGCHE